MKRSDIWKIFKAWGIELHPAGRFLRSAEDGSKMCVQGRDDFLDIREHMEDNFLKYRPEESGLLVVDIDDLASVWESKCLSMDIMKLLESTFHYRTSNTNKMHYVFRAVESSEIPQIRKTHDNNRHLHNNIDIISYGIVFTGHFYSDKDTSFEIFNKDIIELDDELIKYFVGDIENVESLENNSISINDKDVEVLQINPKRDNWSQVGEGSRNDELYKSCCSELACNIDSETVKGHAVLWNSGLKEPLGEMELMATIASAVKIEKDNYPNGRDYSNSDDGFDVVTTFVENYNLETGEFESDAVVERLVDKENKKDSLAIDLIYNKSDIEVWFDLTYKKYAFKKSNEILYLNKNDFKQCVESEVCKVVTAKDFVGMPKYKSEYNPMMGDEFKDGAFLVKNTFKPSKLMKFDKKCAVSEIPLNINKLINNLFSSNSEMKPLFLNWLSAIYQYRIKTGVAWALVGKQGTGKGIFVETIMNEIFKNHIRLNVTDTLLSGQFNGWLSDTLFVQLNEISTDYKSRIAVKNKIKTWVTDYKIEIERKGVDSTAIDSFSNFIINSNEEIPLDVDDDDRRFNIVHCGSKLSECSWFNEDSVDDIRAECEEFAKFLACYNVDMKLVKKVVMNDRKRKIIESSRTLDEDMIDCIKRRDLEWFDIDNEIVLADISSEFSRGFISNKTIEYLYRSVHSNDSFGIKKILKILSKYDAIGEKGSLKISGKTLRGFKLDVEDMDF